MLSTMVLEVFSTRMGCLIGAPDAHKASALLIGASDAHKASALLIGASDAHKASALP